MPHLPSVSSRTKYSLIALGIGVVLVLSFSLLPVKTSQRDYGGIPLPFSRTEGSLKGLLTFFEKRGTIDIYEVTFLDGEASVILTSGRVYLVRIPREQDIQNVPLDLVFSTFAGDGISADYYGYRYVDAVGTQEKWNAGAPRFADRFPGQFFASKKARSVDATRGNTLTSFEQVNGITLLPTSNATNGVRIDSGGGLYMLVINEANGVELHPRSSSPGCGNGRVDGNERCDDGNTVEGDGCPNDCGVPESSIASSAS